MRKLNEILATKRINNTSTDEERLKELMIVEAVKKISNPFANWTVKEVMRDLRVGEATANAIFKRDDFPSVNIGKTKTVTLLAYLIWKMDKRESVVSEDGQQTK